MSISFLIPLKVVEFLLLFLLVSLSMCYGFIVLYSINAGTLEDISLYLLPLAKIEQGIFFFFSLSLSLSHSLFLSPTRGHTHTQTQIGTPDKAEKKGKGKAKKKVVKKGKETMEDIRKQLEDGSLKVRVKGILSSFSLSRSSIRSSTRTQTRSSRC